MNKFRGKGIKGQKTTEFYRSGGLLRNFQMKSGGLGPGEILQRGRRRIVKKWGRL